MVVLLLLSMILIMTRERVARNFVSQVFLSSWPALQPGRFPPMSSCGIRFGSQSNRRSGFSHACMQHGCGRRPDRPSDMWFRSRRNLR